VTFNSLQYAAFFAVVLFLYWRLNRRQQNVLLLLGSYVFYGAWDPRFLPLMWLSTAVDYYVGRRLEDEPDQSRRKRIFALSLVVNLGVLATFKYFNFFLDSADGLFQLLGADVDSPTLRILLPVGISFYTFHGISYTFDVYRREIAAARRPLDFAVFVAFFPQLVAGPIGRAHLQLPQFQNPRRPPSGERVASALFLILLGLFKKVVLADGVARFADAAFATGGDGFGTLLIGVYAFAIQIYADFCGYTDIARGSARLMGIELPRNFEQPYLSRSITEFWRRWHISLSSWLRDYLYIPLGGNRGGRRRTYRNLMLTMGIGGLWHGAAWTFVIWGVLHGTYLSVHKWWTDRGRPAPAPRPAGEPLPSTGMVHAPGEGGAVAVKTRVEPERTGPASVPTGLGPVLGVLVTFHLVCLAWIFFRADSLRLALRYCKGLATFRPGPVDLDAVAVVLPALVVMVALDVAQRRAGDDAFILRMRPLAQGVLVAVLATAILVFSGGTSVPFIYFQF